MPSDVRASRTSSSLKGLKIAMTNFIAHPPPGGAPVDEAPGARRVPVDGKARFDGVCAPSTVAASAGNCHLWRMENERFDLAVVGAGLSGSLLALAAGEAGLATALIDRVPLRSFTDAGFDGRTTAIAYTSQRLYAALGVWRDIADQAEPILDIRISVGRHGRRPRFGCRESVRPGRRCRATRRPGRTDSRHPNLGRRP